MPGDGLSGHFAGPGLAAPASNVLGLPVFCGRGYLKCHSLR